MTRMAGDAMKGGLDLPMPSGFSMEDKDLVEMDDGTKVHKDEVKDYVKNNYKKNDENKFGGFS